MPAPNQNPMYDPMANKPKLSTMPPQVTNDVAGGSLVRPMSPPMPPTQAGNQRRQIGGSSGGNFSPAAWNAANQRAPRPVNVLPGIGMGPMPVGTKPLPDPMVRSGGKPPMGARDFMDRGIGSLFPDGKGGFLTPDGRTVQIPNYGNMQDMKGGLGPGSMGKPPMGGGRDTQNPYPPGSPEYEMWMRKNRGQMLEEGGGARGGAGGVGADGVWTPPSQEYLDGLQSGAIAPKWAGAPGSDTYQGWLNLKAMRGDQYGSGQGGNQTDTMPQPVNEPQPNPGARQPLRPGMRYSPRGGQRPISGGVRGMPQAPVNPQALQQGAQALYGDNTIPHEFKGQLLQAAQSGDAQAFNDMLFNSGIPHETKLRLQQTFGYGSGAPTQAATPDQGVQQAGAPGGFDPRMGSGYYGAF